MTSGSICWTTSCRVPIRVIEESVAIEAMVRARDGTMPCHPRYGGIPTNSTGQKVILTASQLVPHPIRPATTGMLAYFHHASPAPSAGAATAVARTTRATTTEGLLTTTAARLLGRGVLRHLGRGCLRRGAGCRLVQAHAAEVLAEGGEVDAAADGAAPPRFAHASATSGCASRTW